MSSSVTTTTTTALSKGKVKLSGAQETMLLTVFARARDAESTHPILNDNYALEIVNQIKDQGYDFNRTSVGFQRLQSFAAPVAMRGRMLDICTERFLRRNPGPATVLHLACGVDSRCHRVQWQGEGRVWIDAEREGGLQLRRQVLHDPTTRTAAAPPGKGGAGGGEYRLIHPNIHSDTWLRDAKVPVDRPVLVLFEGLTPYLTDDEMVGLVRRLVNYFRSHGAHGELRFDAIGSITYYVMNHLLKTPFKIMGTRFRYYLDDPRSLPQKVPGLRFKDTMFLVPDLFRFGFLGLILWFCTWLMDLFGVSGRLGGGYGYEF